MNEAESKQNTIKTTRDGRMNLEDTCKLLGIKPNTMYEWIRCKKAPPHFHLGHYLFFYYQDVKKWIRQQYERQQKKK